MEWYQLVKRDFPWRQDTDPYHVWVSEIMLQQTRIEAALGYYTRFMTALPTLADLAEVEEDKLLKLWEGLGYYSRARNLKKAAFQVMQHHGGQLPADYQQLLSLPGIGEYTAGAIASISFDIPVPAVDGNVLRVLARLTANRGDVLKPATKRELSAIAAAMVPQEFPGTYNQAIMELGERVCLPNTQPYCCQCPLADACEGHRLGIAAELPTRTPKKDKKVEEHTVLVLVREQHGEKQVLLHRRSTTGLLANLWELPSMDGWCGVDAVKEYVASLVQPSIKDIASLPNAKHLFSHIEWRMKGVCIHVETQAVPNDCVWVDATELAEDYALPSAFRAYAKLLPDLLAKGVLS